MNATRDTPDPLVTGNSRMEAKFQNFMGNGAHQHNNAHSEGAYGQRTMEDHCGGDDADAGVPYSNHTQRPDVVQGHFAHSRRRIEATTPPSAQPAKRACEESAGSAPTAVAPVKSKQPLPAGNTEGEKTARAPPGAIPSEEGARDGELDEVPSWAHDMFQQMEARIGALFAHHMGSLRGEVGSLSARMDAVEAHLGIGHAAQN